MGLIFAVVAGAILGLAARYCLPRRVEHGLLLVPCLGAAFAAALFTVLRLVGLAIGHAPIWVITLIGTAIVAAAADLVLGTVRARRDEALLIELSGGRVNDIAVG